ncbi:M28 family peptidase [Novosphingobium sp.]|uniref:M28 family peptidase n=1 Tax=Novosphingobium sp. TaxID=1874826 RepID=UPI0035B194B3
MRNKIRAIALSALLLSTAANAAPPQGSGTAWDILADMTTEVGQRLAGSPREAAAREWGVARLKTLGFSNVHIEPFTITGFVRGAESAELTAPYPQKLHITALGYSAPTPKGGLTGELVYFPTLDALKAAPEGSLRGKIVFVDHAMRANQDGSGYGPYGSVRRQGPGIASAKGAAGIVIRSVGTDSNRDPHTGVTSWPDGVKPIPAGAVSAPDANLIARIAGTGKPMTIALVLESHAQPNLPSGNVVADLPGRDPSLPPILVACHLDSWDLGTGAIDDAAGCAIVTSAALRAQEGGKPLRTIRVLWAGSEELGGFGGEAYAKAHASEPHAVAMESDFGAGRVWRVRVNFAESNQALGERVKTVLSPLGIVAGGDLAHGGTDVEPVISAQKLAVVDLDQDGTRYFDLHHTPDDTLDKVDPAELEQNVAAWTAVLQVIANEPGPISGN